MKKTKYILMLSLSVLIINATAQSVKWADEAENASKIRASDMAGYTDKSVFLIKKTDQGEWGGDSKFFLDRYDLPNMNKIWTKEMWGTDDGTDKGKSLHISNVYSLIDGVLVIALSHDFSTVYAMQVRVEDGVLLDSRKVTIGDMEAKNEDQRKSAPFKFAMSKDRTTLLGYYVSRHSPTIHTIAIDANLNIKWKKDITPSFSNNDFDLKEISSLDGNEIAILASINDKGSDQKYKFVTIYYNHSKDSKFETEMSLGGDKLIDGIKINMDAAGNPIAAGMYKNDGEKGLFGTFGFRINANTGQIMATSSAPFTTDFLTNFISERKADKGKGIPYLQVNEIYVTADNSIVIAAERNTFSEEHTYWEPNNQNGMPTTVSYANSGPGMAASMHGGITTTYYNYKDIVLAKLDGKTCNTEWAIIIPKKQTTDAKLKKSYGLTIQGSTIFVAFCDNRKNADMDPKVFTQDASKLKTADLDDNGKYLDMTLCTVDLGSGAVQRKYLTKYKEDASKLVFSALTLTALPHSIFVYRGDKHTDQSGILTLQ